ncbi:DEAD/DEAH box helicase [Derxia gummosa]|uniref:DEAD-box ATP-dependent RNA helicase RhpA n=1 Tax=Derxia gummosa DSM 723 TaxID=1121388 RepID=A0A8B6X8C2_9BURK|nr:DEAD/DEAH box helicase [Derxia gummosa]
MNQATTTAPEGAQPDFSTFGLDAAILRAIVEQGYTTPTPIQQQAIPIALQGRDLMGAAQTGTGKTAGFSLPILQRLVPTQSASVSPARHPVRALILAPTRELADQVADNVATYAKHTQLRSAVVFGGVDIRPQIEALRAGVEIVIATPGRLLDHVQQKSINLSQVQILVLDEADRMLDMGFLPDLQRIVNLLPQSRQTLLFSATFSDDIKKLARSFLRDPATIEVARRNSTNENVTQTVYAVAEPDKHRALVQVLRERELKQVIVFVNKKLGAGRLSRLLERDGIPATAIHGDRSQAERTKALEDFKAGTIEVLVATDVAARGLDISALPAVINFDIPYNAEDYVHRIGRTGRAGATGDAISFCSPEEERSMADIEKLIKSPLKREALRLPARERFGDERPAGRADGARPARDDARAPRDDARPPRADRDDSRGDRPARSHGATGHGIRHGRGAPVDEFFLKPYEPSGASVAAAKAESEADKPAATSAIKRKQNVGLLLGGYKR